MDLSANASPWKEYLAVNVHNEWGLELVLRARGVLSRTERIQGWELSVLFSDMEAVDSTLEELCVTKNLGSFAQTI